MPWAYEAWVELSSESTLWPGLWAQSAGTGTNCLGNRSLFKSWIFGLSNYEKCFLYFSTSGLCVFNDTNEQKPEKTLTHRRSLTVGHNVLEETFDGAIFAMVFNARHIRNVPGKKFSWINRRRPPAIRIIPYNSTYIIWSIHDLRYLL